MSRNDETRAVYVQTNGAEGNTVIAFRRRRRRPRGAGGAATGGAGSGVPHLPSQSVVLTGDGRYLLVTNAGSHDVSVLAVSADGLELVQALPSGGTAPTSVAERGGLVYVLNSGDPSLRGFRLGSGGLEPVPGSAAIWPPTPTRRRWASRRTGRKSWSPSGSRTRSSSTPCAKTARSGSPRRRPRRARRPTASPSQTALSSSPRPSARRRARRPPRLTSSRTARRRRCRARSATVAARSAGRSPPRTAGTRSRRTSPTGRSRATRSPWTAGVLEDAVAGLRDDDLGGRPLRYVPS